MRFRIRSAADDLHAYTVRMAVWRVVLRCECHVVDLTHVSEGPDSAQADYCVPSAIFSNPVCKRKKDQF